MKKIIAIFISMFYSLLIYSKPQLKSKEHSTVVPDDYIIILNQETPSLENVKAKEESDVFLREFKQKLEKSGAVIKRTFSLVFLGFHAELSASSLEVLERDPDIKMIVKDSIMSINNDGHSLLAVKSWGLDRLDQEDLPLDDTYSPLKSGPPVHAYIFDTGIRASHVEFQDRVLEGFSAFDDDQPSNEDCHGHGTHVAGTVGGLNVGVAPKTKLHPVRVLNCSGSGPTSGIIAGLEWVIKNHKTPAVVNMSLGGSNNRALDLAVKNTTEAGVHVVVSAGNDGDNACKKSPASAPEAITVAASTRTDALASYSNFGTCVDVIAPGTAIRSARSISDDQYRVLSGTSMASPHVAGAVALTLQAYPYMPTSRMSDYIKGFALSDKILGPKGSPNLLLNINKIGFFPYVYAGDDIIIKRPKNNVLLKGLAKTKNGRVVGSNWMELSHPGQGSVFSIKAPIWRDNLVLNRLEVGIYNFRFKVFTDLGYDFYDDVRVIVADGNIPPFADAGDEKGYLSNRAKAALVLDGSRSYDLDGVIESYDWEILSAPEGEIDFVQRTTVNPLIKRAPSGEYQLSLTVTDDQGAQSKDLLNIYVNWGPVVTATKEHTLVWPTNSVFLDGSSMDPDGEVVYTDCFQLSGPSKSTIVNKKSHLTEVKDLELGTYKIRLRALDNFGEYGLTDVLIHVIESDSGEGLPATF